MMNAVAEQAETKPKAKRKKAETGQAQEPSAWTRLIAWAALYGLIFVAEQIDGWEAKTREELGQTLMRFDALPANAEKNGVVPEWLLAWEAPAAELLSQVEAEGKQWRETKHRGDAVAECPYPASLKVSQAWIKGAGETLPDKTDSAAAPREAGSGTPEAKEAKADDKPAEPAAVVAPVAVPTVAVPTPESAAAAKKAPERLTCTKREKCILKLVHNLGKVTPLCNAAEAEYRTQQALANQKKKNWESYQEQMAAICTQISNVENGGDYQPDLFDESKPAEPITPPHPDVHQEGKAKHAEPAKEKPVESALMAAVDEGGNLDLLCLTTKELVKLCGKEWSEYGLTESKIEILKSACEGSTIAKLEAMQRENPNWNRDIKGFGEKWIDKLQDAHLAIRTKFPMPVPGESAPAAAEPAKEDPKPAGASAASDKAGTVLDPSVEAK